MVWEQGLWNSHCSSLSITVLTRSAGAVELPRDRCWANSHAYLQCHCKKELRMLFDLKCSEQLSVIVCG